MSQFSETLTRLMRQKHLKSVELCETLSIRKSRFSKIKNGGILPTDFSLVEQLAKAMHLNPQEEKELYLSYQMSKFGHTYEQIEASMKRLYEVECPQYYQKEECLDTPVSAENGHLYTNKMAVLAAVQRLCLNTASVRIAIQPEDQDLLEILGRCVASCGDTVPMQWLFWLEPSDGRHFGGKSGRIFESSASHLCGAYGNSMYLWGFAGAVGAAFVPLFYCNRTGCPDNFTGLHQGNVVLPAGDSFSVREAVRLSV